MCDLRDGLCGRCGHLEDMQLWAWGQVGVQGLAQEADTGAGGADTENIQDTKGRETD